MYAQAAFVRVFFLALLKFMEILYRVNIYFCTDICLIDTMTLSKPWHLWCLF